MVSVLFIKTYTITLNNEFPYEAFAQYNCKTHTLIKFSLLSLNSVA